jgi:hypothetical protein
MRITSGTKISIGGVASPSGQLHIKGNTDESVGNHSIVLDDNGDVRRCYISNGSGDLYIGGVNSNVIKSRLIIQESGDIMHRRADSTGNLRYQFYATTSTQTGMASNIVYTEHQTFAGGSDTNWREGSFDFTVYGNGGDNYMPVLFIPHGYQPQSANFGAPWFGEMWVNNTGSMNPQNYNHTGYNNWATMSFKMRWDSGHWNAKPTMQMIEHYVNYGRPNIADITISGTQCSIIMYLLPMTYKITYKAYRGMNAFFYKNNNVGGSIDYREGGGISTASPKAYSSRDTRYDSNISWGSQGAI